MRAAAHLQSIDSFTLATGLRAANVTRLTWEQVDLSRKLAAWGITLRRSRAPSALDQTWAL